MAQRTNPVYHNMLSHDKGKYPSIHASLLIGRGTSLDLVLNFVRKSQRRNVPGSYFLPNYFFCA
ncbi:hypothetical protein PMI08_00479 [Brevibacillus sp. CF112]|nr:hypothetical protein PMI08_00479 [Brevibacillus sp. CF112]